MNERQKAESKFREVSRRAVARLFARRWSEDLGRSAVAVFAIAAAVTVAVWYFVPGGHLLPWALLPVPVWLLVTAAWAWWRRPAAETALAQWDERADRAEMFVSAYSFSRQEKLDAGELLHVRRASERLEQDAASLARNLPVTVSRRAWVPPLAFLGLVGLSFVPRGVAQDPTLDPGSVDRAKQVADSIVERMQENEKEDGLTPEEKEELEKLEQSVEETAEKLRQLDKETQRDVLAELEEKAHAAEQLAQALDSAAEEMLSSKMLEELARHADTTDFATALQANDLQKGSDEAAALSDKLDHEDLPLEQQNRIEQALDKSLKVATGEDKQTLVGKKLDEARGELTQDEPKQAAEDFKELSEQLDRAKQRQMAKERLEQLAQQLRDSGQKIFGQNPSGIRQLAQMPQDGLRPLGAQQLDNLGGQLPMLQPIDTPLDQLGTPTPGLPAALGQNLPMATGQAPVPGSMPGGFGPPMPGAGAAPIPGTGMGQGFGQGQGAGQGQGLGAPVPGMGSGAGDGGHFAGDGSAGYGNARTDPLAPSNTGVVNAAVTGNGPSQVRDVQQQEHREETSRQSTQLAIEFLKSEEDALADEPLPLSRREQVLRYFTAIRRRLVEQDEP